MNSFTQFLLMLAYCRWFRWLVIGFVLVIGLGLLFSKQEEPDTNRHIGTSEPQEELDPILPLTYTVRELDSNGDVVKEVLFECDFEKEGGNPEYDMVREFFEAEDRLYAAINEGGEDILATGNKRYIVQKNFKEYDETVKVYYEKDNKVYYTYESYILEESEDRLTQNVYKCNYSSYREMIELMGKCTDTRE